MPSPQDMATNNVVLRQMLLNTAPRMRKSLGSFTAPLAGTTRVKLFNVGVVTGLLLDCSAAITIGTDDGIPSEKAPYNLISRVRVTDYDGTDRVNLSGFQLYVLNSVRERTLWGRNNSAAAVATMFVNPYVPTAVASDTLRFMIYVPLAFDVENPVVQLQDLRGAIMAQTAVGEMYLTVDWISSLIGNGDVESLYAGDATTTVVGQSTNFIGLTVWQDYLLPQAIGNAGQIPLPPVDLATVYELNGAIRSSDNLQVGQEKLISYPNVRSVIGGYWFYVTDGAMSNAITRFRLIANGNNILVDNDLRSQSLYQRNYVGSDIQVGTFWRAHREKPIETALYGNIQMGITPSTVDADANIELGFESFYVKGQALPGLHTS